MKKLTSLILAAAAAILAGTSPLPAQNIQLSGKVTGEPGNPIAGVTVTEKNKNNSTVTNPDGRYSISVPKGATVVFSHPGYATEERVVKSKTLNVKLFIEIEDTDLAIPEFNAITIHEEPEHMEMALMVVANDVATKQYSQAEMSPRTNVKYIRGASPLQQPPSSEEYGIYKENRFISVKNEPLSTFSLDVDGASYSNARRMINNGKMPPKDAVRVEEFINYFSYDYPQPAGNDPVKINYEVGGCPWNAKHKLVRVGVKAKEIPSDNLPPSNFVFLIDVSGSMYGRLDMVKSSMKLLADNLRDEDRVAIVVYAGEAGLRLPATPGSDKQKIRETLDGLRAGGSTAGGAGIRLAYEVARKNFIEGGNNRIILCTDGDFNVGVSSPQELETLIEQERKSGIFLTVLGYGMGNYKDNRMQVLAEKGNGNAAYIDNMQEANKVLVNEFGSTMYTVAKDVKIQVEFNPEKVQAYRLVGYESRLLASEDFNDDTKDAGELGAGHTVTVFYEIVPAGSDSPAGSIDPLKYQTPGQYTPASRKTYSDELMTVKLRYKEPDGDVSKKIETVIKDNGKKKPSPDFNFAASVAMFGQLLKDSDFKGDATYDKVISLANSNIGNDPHGYKKEFVRLAGVARSLD